MKRSVLTMTNFTDYSKSFDTIDFYTLIQKTYSLNFSTDFLCCIFDYLTHSQHFVQIDSYCSSFQAAKYGLQDSVLVPMLFNLCVAYMSSIAPDSTCMQYGHDSTLYRGWTHAFKELVSDINSLAK